MDIEIVAMGQHHLDAVLEIERQSFVAPWSRNLFSHELATPISRAFVALIQLPDVPVVAGYICSWIVYEQCNVLKCACHPRYRRRGIGRLLLQHGLQDARQRGAVTASLEVRPSNTGALQFYTACGFSQTGVRKGYYQETGEDAIIMVKNLADQRDSAQPLMPTDLIS